jgi:hypothetical protein
MSPVFDNAAIIVDCPTRPMLTLPSSLPPARSVANVVGSDRQV